MTIASNLPSDTPQDVRDLVEQLEKDRDAARAELNALKSPPRPDVRTIKDKKEYERMKAEALRELARARYGNPVAAAPESKDVRTLSKKEYEEYKRDTLASVRQRKP